MQRQIVMFVGTDASNSLNLWETNGTVAGTHELTGISGANTGTVNQFSGGIFPSDLTAFNGEVLFAGLNTNVREGLWETDGSAAGTREVAGILGASDFFDPTEMTVFNNEVLFNGTNASGLQGLWVTNGTAGGTHEVTGISGARPDELDPLDLTVFKLNIASTGQRKF